MRYEQLDVNRLRAAMLDDGRSCAAIARAAHITKNRLEQILKSHDTCRCYPETICRLSAALDVDRGEMIAHADAGN